jgi:hypothetical protein
VSIPGGGERMPRKLCLAIVAIVVSSTIALAWPATASAEKYWQGNSRDAYGVKATIGTPTSYPWVNVPGFVAAWATNIELNEQINSAQCGWIQGDGQARIKNILLPTIPKSYKEVSTPGGDSIFTLYSSQPLNYSRVYEVVNVPGTTYWKVYIAGQLRGTYLYNNAKLKTSAKMEIEDGHLPVDNECAASFRDVYYKGNSSYMLYDQYNFNLPIGPLWTNVEAPYKYQTYCNWSSW